MLELKKHLIRVLALAAESFPDGLPDADGMTLEERVDGFHARLQGSLHVPGTRASNDEVSWILVYKHMKTL
jgi:hypothetical protein